MPSQLFLSVVKHRQTIITLFKVLYIGMVCFTIFGVISIYRFDQFALFFVRSSKTIGQAAILLYIATVIPGIFRRFKRHNEISSLLMMYRRYIGLLMFFFIVAHAWFNLWTDVLKGFVSFPLPVYLGLGVTAEMLLLLLAVTSNDWATKRLGIWWSRIHSLTYIILWVIFFHVSLVDVGIWSLFLGVTGILVLCSFGYKKFHT